MSSPASTPRQRYVPVETACNYVSVSRTTMYKLIREGEVHSSTIGTHRRIDLHSLDDLMDRRRDRLDRLPPSPPLPPGPPECPDSAT